CFGCWTYICPRLFRRRILFAEKVNDVDVLFPEGAFTPSQVEIPHALKSLIEAQCPNFMAALKETLAPMSQRQRIVRSKTFQIREAQRGCSRQRMLHLADKRQLATGKDVRLDPVYAAAVVLQLLFRHSDRLNQQRTIGRE